MTMFPVRTPSGKVALYDVHTGQQIERWPVDARDLLATGAYTTDQASAMRAVSVDASVRAPSSSAAFVEAANEAEAAAVESQTAIATEVNEMDADALARAEGVTAGVEYADPIATPARSGRPPKAR